MQNYTEDYYRQTQNPYWQGQRLNQLIRLGLPNLRSLLSQNQGNMANMGLYSPSPMGTTSSNVIGNYTSGITSDFYKNLSQEQIQLLQMLAQMRESEMQTKSQRESALFGGIGSLLGLGLQFIPGIGQLANHKNQIPPPNYNPLANYNMNPSFNPGYLDYRRY